MAHISCMGGWCDRRESCVLHTTPDRSHPVDRLCERGQHDSYEPIRVIRQAGTWARGGGGLPAPVSWHGQVSPA